MLPFHPRVPSESESRGNQQSMTQISTYQRNPTPHEQATSEAGRPVIRPHINRMMDNQTPQPQGSRLVRDNSYAARAQQLFHENRMMLSR